MTINVRCRMKPYIQPFERTLAMAELVAVANAEAVPVANDHCPTCVDVRTSAPVETLAASLAYWETVNDGTAHYTHQVLREATVSMVRNGTPIDGFRKALPFLDDVPLPNRRCLRYATHGLHEYRGKFFPQLVKALINIGRVPVDGVIADPMCGSGTTLVESVLAGRTAIGLDINPLSVRLSRAKCMLLDADPARLRKTARLVESRLADGRRGAARGLRYFGEIPIADQEYLRRWFSDTALRDLDAIVGAIRPVRDAAAREMMFIALSNVLRRVSWQKTDDLRIRKDIEATPVDAVATFVAEVRKSVRSVTAFLYQNGKMRTGDVDIVQGDARQLTRCWRRWRRKVDAVVTSPPYATALPYLDTDRLNLCYLGMLTRGKHRETDLRMIGNREITDRRRREYWEYFERNAARLPASVSNLAKRVGELNADSDVGFRRRNMAALLAKYFFDMRTVLEEMLLVVKPGAPVYVVVGENHTIAGSERVEIRTADLLGDIAESLGYGREMDLSMEMLRSRDIFKRNASTTETLLMLTVPSHS